MLETDHPLTNHRVHAPFELDDPLAALHERRERAMTFMRDGDGASEP
jgi:hypothetical protein